MLTVGVYSRGSLAICSSRVRAYSSGVLSRGASPRIYGNVFFDWNTTPTCHDHILGMFIYQLICML